MLGKRIKELRKEAGYTQAELGEKLGVIKQTISSWETGMTSPNNEALAVLSSLFKVSIDYLLGADDNPRKEAYSNGIFFFYFDEVIRDLFKLRVKESMEERGITLKDLSALTEIDEDVCRKYVEGEVEPSLEHLIDISHALEVTTDYLLGQTPKITYYENKVLSPFVRLNNDNKDIVIGKAKDLLREQEAREYDESVAADSLKEAK